MNSLIYKEGGRILLTEQGRAATLPELEGAIRAEGMTPPSRPTLSRARSRGWYAVSKRRSEGGTRKAVKGFVRLSDDEQAMTSVAELADHLGVTWNTARRARNRGWFEVTSTNADKINVPTDRIQLGPLP